MVKKSKNTGRLGRIAHPVSTQQKHVSHFPFHIGAVADIRLARQHRSGVPVLQHHLFIAQRLIDQQWLILPVKSKNVEPVMLKQVVVAENKSVEMCAQTGYRSFKRPGFQQQSDLL